MSKENDYLNILHITNFVGSDGIFVQKQDLSTESGEINQRTDIGIDGGADTDKLWFHVSTEAVYVNLKTEEMYGLASQIVGTIKNIESLVGSTYDDEIHGSDLDDTLNGLYGDDTLYGGLGNDKLYGNNGYDILYGEEGNDKLYLNGGSGETAGGEAYGGAGDDLLYGTNFDDILEGGNGDDILYGEGGNDRMTGDDGDDLMYGGTGNDYLYGYNDNDTMYGDEGVDRLYGGTGEDELHGGDDNDYLYGNEDDDILYGDAGNDNLVGQDGDDTLYGGAGTNDLYGGAGSDTLIYNVNDFQNGYDRLWDYEDGMGGDIIDISNLLTEYDSASDNLQDFVNAYLEGDGTILKVDMDGNGTEHSWQTVVWFRTAGDVGDVDNLIADGNLIVA